jgi:hypothetical protein
MRPARPGTATGDPDGEGVNWSDSRRGRPADVAAPCGSENRTVLGEPRAVPTGCTAMLTAYSAEPGRAADWE